MAPDSSPAKSDLLIRSLAFYCEFMRRAALLSASHGTEQPDLGGHLLFAGEFSDQSRPPIIAANVAGCATLVATADPNLQRQATREGIVDFVVNSLDEALRILKNEVRKRMTVAVCVGVSAVQIEREMFDRGVVPDLIIADAPGTHRRSSALVVGSQPVHPAAPNQDQVLLSWSVAAFPALWMPKLDAIANECLTSEPVMQRWIRLSPRFAGRAALSVRTISCARAAARRIIDSLKQSVDSGAIRTDVSVDLQERGEAKTLQFSPAC